MKKLLRFSLTILVVFWLMVLSVAPVRAYLLNTGVDTTESYLIGDGPFAFQAIAAKFTINNDFTITGIEFYFQDIKEVSLPTVAIYANNPDNTIGALLSFANFTPIYEPGWKGVTSGINWNFEAGTYWVSFQDSGGSEEWIYGGASAIDRAGTYLEGTWYYNNSDSFAVRIEGTQVPCPGALLLLSTGLLGLGALGWRRKRG